VKVVLLTDPAELKGDAATMYAQLPEPPTVVRSLEEWKSERVQEALSADLYVDAILGTGFKPPVSGLYAEAISFLNASQGKVIAVDIPSGADADAMGPQQGIIARSDVTVTFTAPRPAPMLRESGRRNRRSSHRCI
jgi:NAD(P)H-hydrate epimerase